MIATNVYIYTNGGSPIDALNRSYDLIDLAGRKTQYRYACCGLDYVIDPDGATTYYDYDALKRQVATMRVFGGGNGIKTTNVMDAAGRTLVSKRIGTDSSVVTMSQAQYDTLGRPMRQTNALLGVAVITNAIVSNRRCVTNTYADGGTRNETYYRDGRLESVSGTAVSPVHYDYGTEQDGVSGPWREFTLEQKLDSNGGTNEWVKTLYDGADRPYKTAFASSTNVYPYRLINYNSLGQKVAERDPDGVTTLFAYNTKGELVRSAVDMNQNGQIDPTDGNGSQDDDRITDSISDLLGNGASGNSHGTDITRTRTFRFTTMDSVATNLISTLETSTGGLKSWRTVQKDGSTAVTTYEKTAYGSNGYRTNTTSNPDGTTNVTLYLYGRILSVTRKDTSGNQVTQTAYAWDTHGRLLSTTDARNGATTYGYNSADQVTTTTSPDPGLGPQVTTTSYDNMGRGTNVTQPDNSGVSNEYHPTGLLKKTSGSRTYAVGYGYDAQGRMRYMTNWQSFSAGSGTEITRWNYDAYRGWLKSKDYPDATTGNPPGTEGSGGPNYTYTSAGRLSTRVWKRGLTTACGYNNAGDLASTSYSDGGVTPGVTNSYDRRGRRLSVVCNSITTSYFYNDANQTLTETNSGGTLNGLSVSNVFDNYLRRVELNAKSGTNLLQGVGYSHDTAGRLGTVTDNSATSYNISYGYEPNSTLVNGITNKQSGTVRLLTTKQYDKLNRLTQISSTGYGSSAPTLPISYQYQYNSANQRTRMTQEDGSYWIYTYDSLGQVTSGKRYWPDGTAVDGQQFEYGFDDIGNRTTTGGRASSQSSYAQNRLNQYTQRTVPGVVDVQGVANPTASVTVNGNTSDRHGEYFHYALGVANSSAAYTNITVASTFGAGQSTSGKYFVPPAPESYSYDDDGNLTADGRWTYTWDGENRLIQMIRDTDSPTGARQKLTFEYDSTGKRIRKKFYTYSSGWVLSIDRIFVCDGWNLIAELDATSSNVRLRTYTWGIDLSGLMQAAGGVGGLLKVTDYTSGTTHNFVAYDGNGNIAALLDAGTAMLSARYEHGPFGEPLRNTGALGKKNPLRLSSKFIDDESGLYYFGYRCYNPSIGAWVNRDPIEELGGQNLYGYVENSPPNYLELLGRCGVSASPADGSNPPCDSPCQGKLDFTASPPQAVSTKAELSQHCPGGQAACSKPEYSFNSKCERCKDGCKWKIIYNVTADCQSFYADPAKIPVNFPQGVEAVKKHESCHCDDWKAAFNSIINARTNFGYDSAEECEQSRASYDSVFNQSLQARMAPSKRHEDSKYKKGGPCWAIGQLE